MMECAAGRRRDSAIAMGLPLPEDVVADVLRRLPPRSVAASRCVCKAWRAVVDARRLLRPDLLPHSQSVRGIFIECNDLDYPVFLARPHSDPALHLDLPGFFLPGPGDEPEPSWSWNGFASVKDHCNGLLLYLNWNGLHVANPATRRRARLPPPPPRFGFADTDLPFLAHLVFDPAESPHYEVLLVPDSRGEEEQRLQWTAVDDKPSKSNQREWPPPTWMLCVFSSRTGEWEDRAFAREGEGEAAAATASDELRTRYEAYCWRGGRACSAYWRRAFFVQCLRGSRVMRISLSDGNYQLIKVPTDILVTGRHGVFLGTLHKQVCCASFAADGWYKLRVWILDESCGRIQWVLKHQVDMYYSIKYVPTSGPRGEWPWILQDANHGDYCVQQYMRDVVNNDGEDDNKDALLTRKFEWDSDTDNVLDIEKQSNQVNYATFLGFHPYKDVVYLNVSLSKAVAYHLNTAMVQVLGNGCPEYYRDVHLALEISSFVYTPCFMTEFPENELEDHVKN